MTLAYAGSRLSEALAFTADRVDLAAGALVFETLKKRQSGIYRAVPVPPALLDALECGRAAGRAPMQVALAWLLSRAQPTAALPLSYRPEAPQRYAAMRPDTVPRFVFQTLQEQRPCPLPVK